MFGFWHFIYETYVSTLTFVRGFVQFEQLFIEFVTYAHGESFSKIYRLTNSVTLKYICTIDFFFFFFVITIPSTDFFFFLFIFIHAVSTTPKIPIFGLHNCRGIEKNDGCDVNYSDKPTAGDPGRGRMHVLTYRYGDKNEKLNVGQKDLILQIELALFYSFPTEIIWAVLGYWFVRSWFLTR